MFTDSPLSRHTLASGLYLATNNPRIVNPKLVKTFLYIDHELRRSSPLPLRREDRKFVATGFLISKVSITRECCQRHLLTGGFLRNLSSPSSTWALA